jgi:hypothetical protein
MKVPSADELAGMIDAMRPQGRIIAELKCHTRTVLSVKAKWSNAKALEFPITESAPKLYDSLLDSIPVVVDDSIPAGEMWVYDSEGRRIVKVPIWRED